jgi:hypothetical protein
MAEQFTSSPGPSDVRKYQIGQGSYQQTKTAFQSISQQVLLSPEALASDPYVRYLGATDPLAQAREFNKLYAGLVGTGPSAGSKFNNAFQELQALLRAKGYSKGKSPLGIVEGADQSGLTKAIQDSLAMGQTDVIQFLSALSARPGAGPKQIDTTTKFSTQISRALQLKDIGDATNALTDAFMLAYNIAPGNDLITDFQKKWNAEVKAQTPSTKSRNQVVMVPVFDSKTGKQKKDKNGKPKFKPLVDAKGVKQYEPVTTSDTVIAGEGFTSEEQKEFMANYLAVNFPQKDWNMEKIGGAAKTIYDAMVQVSNNNFEKPPTFEEAAPTITKIIGTGNAEVAAQLLGQYQSNTRNSVAKRFMSLAPDIAAGNDAKPIIDRYSNFLSEALETSIGIDDPLMVRILNYKDDKGNYRLPNDFELSTLTMDDTRSGGTSRAINQSVNVAQSLQSQLQIG